MKKFFTVLLFFILCFDIYCLEIRTNKIIGTTNRQVFTIDSINEMYNTKDRLFLKTDFFNTKRFFVINSNSNIVEIDEEKYILNKSNCIEKTMDFKYGYKLNIDKELLAYENSFPDIYGYNSKLYKDIIPLYFYINSKSDEIIFNFNLWKNDKKEYFPEDYTYNSLNEKKFYTDEERERLMKLSAAFTLQDKYLINYRKNKIAIVLRGHNSINPIGLVIFDVLYNATINDYKVKLYSEPNANSQTLSFFYEGNKVKIIDQTEDQYEIDGESWYWYKVESGTYPIGWVYGKYLDIENQDN